MIIDAIEISPHVLAVVTQATETTFESTIIQPRQLDDFKYVPWYDDDNLPNKILEYVGKNEVLSAGTQFNISAIYGSGIKVQRKISEGEYQDVTDEKVLQFMEDNDLDRYLLEQISDLTYFFNVFPEIILDKAGKNILLLNSKEATYSRWAMMNEKTGLIETHFYSAEFMNQRATKDNTDVTPVLNPNNPLMDLRIRMSKNKKDRRFIIPVNFPTPGKSYYQRPYWWSVFESGWYDISMLIPSFKRALMTNQMTIKYHIELHEKYFDTIYEQENIRDAAKQAERRKEELQHIRDYLSGSEKAGKAMVSYVKYSGDGKSINMMKINVLENKFKGGEYIEDSTEASNILSYAMGVHPAIIGAAPGKNSGSLSGTDKRELFTIKQAIVKPFRDMLLKPLYLIRNFNKWDRAIEFTIPDIHLTTLDKGTDAKPILNQ